MASSEARVAMDTPARYLGQLCKHFQHRLPVTLDDASGCIVFPSGTCALKATPEDLLMRVTSDDAGALPQLQDVVARHLLRFAFRSPPEITWTPVPE